MRAYFEAICPYCEAIHDLSLNIPIGITKFVAAVACQNSTIRPTEMQRMGCGKSIAVSIDYYTTIGKLQVVTQSKYLHTLKEFEELCAQGEYTYLTGSGFFATQNQVSNLEVDCEGFDVDNIYSLGFDYIYWIPGDGS